MLAFRIESERAELWVPRRDVLPGGELLGPPGNDLAFRVYLSPRLRIQLEGRRVTVSWPAGFHRWDLQRSADLRSAWAAADRAEVFPEGAD